MGGAIQHKVTCRKACPAVPFRDQRQVERTAPPASGGLLRRNDECDPSGGEERAGCRDEDYVPEVRDQPLACHKLYQCKTMYFVLILFINLEKNKHDLQNYIKCILCKKAIEINIWLLYIFY